MDFHVRMQKTLARRKAEDRRLRRIIACILLLVCAWLACGFLYGEETSRGHVSVETVQEVYTVRDGDTLRDISRRYLARNTGSTSYILAFEHGIRERNPWLAERHGLLLPGDRLVICYEVQKRKSD